MDIKLAKETIRAAEQDIKETIVAVQQATGLRFDDISVDKIISAQTGGDGSVILNRIQLHFDL